MIDRVHEDEYVYIPSTLCSSVHEPGIIVLVFIFSLISELHVLTFHYQYDQRIMNNCLILPTSPISTIQRH